MGAEFFTHKSNGKTAQEAFEAAVKKAQYDHGHRGYSGTIAEKSSFTMIKLPEGIEPGDYADLLNSKNDPRIDDKWGPAGCFEIKPGEEYYFFGWASS
jgi:hypothetical protein